MTWRRLLEAGPVPFCGMKNYEFVYAEITVSPEKMQNLPESASPWFVPHADRDAEREPIMDEMTVLINRMTQCLTSRQKKIIRLHYYEQQTQVEIAEALGISQAAVNHHLIGKIKGGKVVGGALQGIQRSIRKKASKYRGSTARRYQSIFMLNNMLDKSLTRRKTDCYLRILFNLSRNL